MVQCRSFTSVTGILTNIDMDTLDLIEFWAEDNGLRIKWEDTSNHPRQYFFTVVGMRGYDQNLIDDLDFALGGVGYMIDMAYDNADGVYMEVARA